LTDQVNALLNWTTMVVLILWCW